MAGKESVTKLANNEEEESTGCSDRKAGERFW